MDFLNEIGDFLNTYGGWGVCIVEGVVIVYMARHIRDLNKANDKIAMASANAIRAYAADLRMIYGRVGDALGMKTDNANLKSLSTFIPVVPTEGE